MTIDLGLIQVDCDPILIEGSCIRFPGGAEICFTLPNIPGSDGEALRGLLAQVNSALAPLAPIFNIIDAIIAVFNCVSAVPDAIANLDPIALFECVPDMAEKIAALAQLIPQLSIPATVVDILDLIIRQLQSLRNDLFRIAVYQNLVIAQGLKAAEPGRIALRLAVDCAQVDIDFEIASLNAQNEPLNRLIGIIGLLLAPFGINLSESLGTITDVSNIEETLAPIDALIDVLVVVRKLVPLP